jgi:lysophospholipase L1-like esterase
MIVFLGDSFTWGQGLFYEKWASEGKDVKNWIDINGNVAKYPHENVDYESDKYRRENHFPAIVAKHFNKAYTTRWGNGGSNWDIINILNNIPSLAPQYRTTVDLFIIQFTDFTRTSHRLIKESDLINESAFERSKFPLETDYDDNTIINKLFHNELKLQIAMINDIIVNKIGKKWIGISWFDDMGKVLEEEYLENHIPVHYNDKIYNSFEIVYEDQEREKNLLFLSEKFNIKDNHFNLEGHQFVANNIIQKIDKNELLKSKLI